MNKTHMNVTIRSSRQTLTERDLRIPRSIEIKQFIEEIEAIFHVELCREKFQLRIVNKGLILDEGKQFQHYLVTDGDIIEIMEDV